jgi:outer membrane receptor protein involved in Fe transport
MDYFYISNPNNPAARFQIDYNKKPYEGAVYIQDKIEFSTIILNLGLRFDFYDPSARYTPNPYDNSRVTEADPKTSFSPRVGVAYPVRDNMVFHFSYGQFFQRPEYQVMYENLNREFSYDQPIFGNPNLEPEKTNSYEIGLNTTLGENATLQTTFFSKKIENLVGVVWDYERLAYASYVNEDFAQVKGFEISSEWDIRNLSLSANYTYQIAEGSSSSQQERYSGAFDIIGKQSLKFLPLDFDQRHSANGSINIYFRDNEGPFGFLPSIFENINVNFIMRYGSGLPYTFNPARSRYVAERNNSRLPSTFFMDMYLSKRIDFKDFYLTIFADVRNLLDRDNVRSVYSATGKPDETGSLLSDITPDYEQDPTNYYNPRTIYFGAKIGI